MHKQALLIALAILFLGVNAQPSEASPAWKCAKRHCYWVEGYTGPQPEYATKWGPPEQPGCYWALGRFSKRWTQVCPVIVPMYGKYSAL
jgi:hypothetical protein